MSRRYRWYILLAESSSPTSEKLPVGIQLRLAEGRCEGTMTAWRASRLNHLCRFWTVFRRAMMKLNRRFLPKLIRGFIGLSVLLGVCAMLFPLPIAPLPQNLPEKDSSEPFPCQSRPCGCRSADQCWKKCCCFNNAQKVAWAKANNVKIPDFVLVAAKTEQEANDRREICSFSAANSGNPSGATSATSCEHCAKKLVVKSTSVCCQKAQDSTVDATVCTKPGPSESSFVAPAKKISEDEPGRSTPSESKWVLAIYAAECQGQGPPTFCFPTSIVPDRISLVIPTVVAIEMVPLESERLQQTSLRPPLPPPKIV